MDGLPASMQRADVYIEILNLFGATMIRELAECSLMMPRQLCDSFSLLFYEAMPRDQDSSGAVFAFTSALSAQDNLKAVHGAPDGFNAANP